MCPLLYNKWPSLGCNKELLCIQNIVVSKTAIMMHGMSNV